ncbi:ABC transporter substrate-binding protein [Pseudonocardia sp. CA-142604]|uniref:ABC transporter substrate-binding protein n=1 Tax=Pseudonocardia sp. CA-142604 TaxID=3240024 RepID=UPI003D92223A
MNPFGGDPGAEGTPQRGGTLLVGMSSEITSFDPTVFSGNVAATAVYDSLLRLGPDGKPQPELAQSMESPDGGRTWRMGLRPGVRFQDGTDFDANAVVINVQRHIDSISSPAHAHTERIKSMSVVDPLTVEFNLTEPMGEFPTVFALAFTQGTLGMIISPAALEKYGAEIGRHPIGAGPFTFEEWIPDSRITFVRNDDYWQADLPYLDGIEFRPLPDTDSRFASMINGDVDLISAGYHEELSRALADPDLEVYYGPGDGGELLRFNHTKPPFDDHRMREAVLRAIDPKALSATAYRGQMVSADSLFAAGSPYHTQAASDAWPRFDPAVARQLVEAYRADGGNPNFTFKVANDRVSFAEFVQAQMKTVGIDVDIQIYDPAQYATALMRSGDFQLAFSLGPVDSLYPGVARLLRTDGTANHGKYSNPEVDRLLDRAMLTTDPEERAEAYRQVELISGRDLAVGWFSRGYASTITRPEVNGVSRYLNLAIWFDRMWIDRHQ